MFNIIFMPCYKINSLMTRKKRIRFKNISKKSTKKKKIKRTLTPWAISYSPTVNKKLLPLLSITPYKKMNISCKNNKVMVEGKCIGWNTKKSKNAALTNLVSKKKINCDKITAPKQILANCWFNVFFMIFFISDKGRKFFRHMREVMITGIKLDGSKVDRKFHKVFFMLNQFIESSLRGEDKKFNTNKIIRSLHNKLKITPPTNKSGNPFDFYKKISHLLSNEPLSILELKHIPNKRFTNSYLPHIMVLELYHDTKRTHILQKYYINNHLYILHDAVLMDLEDEHFSCYLICNKKEYGFDGYSYSRMQSMKWRKNINSKKKWSFKGEYGDSKWEVEKAIFSFHNSYQMLFYYRQY